MSAKHRLLCRPILFNIYVGIFLQSRGMSLCGGCIHLLLLFVEDDHVLEVHVRGVEVSTIDGAVEWETKRLVIRVLEARPNAAVAEGLVVVGLEVVFVLLDVGCQDDVESEGLASLLASRQQQALRVATVAFTLQQGTAPFQQGFGRPRFEQAGRKQ